MPKTRFTILLALSLLVFPVALSAQGSGSTAPLPVPVHGGGAIQAYNVIVSITGTLLRLADNGKTFQVMDERTGQAYTFTLGERTRFRADKKVMGKKKIEWSELEEGHRVRVTVKVPQNSATKVDPLSLDVREIKVIKPKVT